MQQIITYLLMVIEQQKQIINFLCILVFGKAFKPKPEKITDKKYLKLSVDPLPTFGKAKITKLYDWKELIKAGNIKPIRRRGGIVPPKEAVCPYCGAPHEYVYDNNGGRGAYWCKVCNNKFAVEKPTRDDEPYCPFCGSKLSLIKKRKTFDIYRCHNMDCIYRKRKLSAMDGAQKALFKASPHNFKIRYIYRKFHWDFTPLSKDNDNLPTVELSNITATPHVLGLILTYHINYGLPLRKTAALMFDVHQVKVSHQTIANYCNAVAPRIKPFVDGFDYDLSDSFCGDETYIKIKGKWQYIFFFFDSVKKIILSYRVRKHRDWQSATLAINDVLVKLKDIPKNLNLITDGNPIYLLAQHFLAGHGINFASQAVVILKIKYPYKLGEYNRNKLAGLVR